MIATVDEVILGGLITLLSIALGYLIRSAEAARHRTHERSSARQSWNRSLRMDRWRLLSDTYGNYMGQCLIQESSWTNALRTGGRPSPNDLNSLSGRIKIVGSEATQDATERYVKNHVAVFEALSAIRGGEKVDLNPIMQEIRESREAMVAAMQEHLKQVLAGDHGEQA